MGDSKTLTMLQHITSEDLRQFKIELIEDIRTLLSTKMLPTKRPWLKTTEVRKLLNISANTLQRLRSTGKLSTTKIGGVHYYRYEDIERLMDPDRKMM